MPNPVSVDALYVEVRSRLMRGFLWAMFVGFFINFAMLIGPLFMIQTFSRVLPSRSLETLTGLMLIGGLGVLIFGLLDFTRNWTFAVMSQGLARRINLPALEAGVLQSINSGAMAGGQVIRDISELRLFIAGPSLATPIDAFWSLIFLAGLYVIHPLYFTVAVGYVVVMAALNVITDRLTRQSLIAANQSQARHLQDVADSLRHAEVIESMGMLPALSRGWRKSEQVMLAHSNAAAVRSRVVIAISKSLMKSLQMATVATGAYLVIRNEVTSSVLFAGLVLTSQSVAPFSSLIEHWRHWVEARESWVRIRKIITTKGSDRQTMPFAPGDGGLVVENLVYLPDGINVPILRGINFKLSPGQVLGIAGPSGAGKSTLARCLTGVLKPTAGGAFLDGQSTYLWERESFGRAVGYLPQALSIIDGTVRQTIERMNEDDPRKVIRAAQMAGIHELIGRLPFGYDTPVSEKTTYLSGGQLQRLALARALYGDPKLVILDEPNSNLDRDGEQALIAAINELRRSGAMVIIIAHRPSVMASADLIMVLEEGRITQFGPRTDVIHHIEPGARQRSRRGQATSTRSMETSGEAAE